MCRVLSPSSPSVLAPPAGVGTPAARARAPLGATRQEGYRPPRWMKKRYEGKKREEQS